MDKKTDLLVSEIEKLSRVTQDQYFLIKESNTTNCKSPLTEDEINEMKFRIHKTINSKLYRYFLKLLSRRLKRTMKFLKKISDKL